MSLRILGRVDVVRALSTGVRWHTIRSPQVKGCQEISDVQMVHLFPAHQTDEERAAAEVEVNPSNPYVDDGLPVLRNVFSTTNAETDILAIPSYRVTWFEYDVHPTIRFLFWAFRRVRELPPDWRAYYRSYLRQETKAQLHSNNTWDVFMGVVDGYRKAKWVLRKYDVVIDTSLIPHPYNDFWECTTPEERAWAYRRATTMKEQQAVQRAMAQMEEDDDLGTPITRSSTPVFGGRQDVKEWKVAALDTSTTSKTQHGSRIHSHDLEAPKESDINDAPHVERYNSFVMGTVEDDKLWNPVLRNRLYLQNERKSDLYAFEDDDEFTT